MSELTSESPGSVGRRRARRAPLECGRTAPQPVQRLSDLCDGLVAAARGEGAAGRSPRWALPAAREQPAAPGPGALNTAPQASAGRRSAAQALCRDIGALCAGDAACTDALVGRLAAMPRAQLGRLMHLLHEAGQEVLLEFACNVLRLNKGLPGGRPLPAERDTRPVPERTAPSTSASSHGKGGGSASSGRPDAGRLRRGGGGEGRAPVAAPRVPAAASEQDGDEPPAPSAVDAYESLVRSLSAQLQSG